MGVADQARTGSGVGLGTVRKPVKQRVEFSIFYSIQRQ